MELTRDVLVQKLKELAQQRDQHLANYHTVNGAIQLCQLLLAELDAAPPSPAEGEKL